MNKDMILGTTSPDLQLCPASPETREIFRPTIHLSDPITTVNLKPHQQNPRKKRSKTMRVQNTKPIVGGSDSSKGRYGKKPEGGGSKMSRACSECGKSFWSWKALFGHMRCHPERPWRGINPPSAAADRYNTTTNEDRYVASCLLMLAKGPRSRYEECKKVRIAKMRKEGGEKRWHSEATTSSSVCRLDLNLPAAADATSQDYSNLGLDLRLGL